MEWEPQRESINPVQALLGKKAARMDTSELYRPKRVTHAIDMPEPYIAADRDDGIWIEKTETGYRVHVTIADVAARVPPHSMLGQLAYRRAFTVYEKQLASRDTMFPRELEGAASLEHGRENLGLAVVMDFDEGYHLQHTHFEKVKVTPDNVSYKTAAKKAEQGSDDYALLAKLGKGVRETNLQGEVWDELRWLEGQSSKRYLEPGEAAFMRHVETFMLMANMAVASIADKAQLPFMYRNFGDVIDDDGVKRAYYSPDPTQHDAFTAVAHSNRYCHFTSPIRRGPDFMNAHQVHYITDVIEALYSGIQKDLKFYDTAKVNRVLWAKVSEIVAKLQPVCDAIGNNSTNGTTQKGEFVRYLKEKLLPEMGVPQETIDSSAVQALAVAAWSVHRPYNKEQLTQYAERINHLNRQDAQRNRELQNHMMQGMRETELRHWDGANVSQLERTQLMSKLRTAAMSEEGYLPDALFEELRKRIKSGKAKALDWADAGLYIMVVARFPQDEKWRRLKRDMCKVLKKDPGLVDNVLSMAQMNLDKMRDFGLPGNSIDTLEEHNAELFENLVESLQPAAEPALMVLNIDGKKVCAPYVSIGHDRRMAMTHAKYSLLEHYAFGELVNLEETAVPDLFYQELNSQRKGTSREDVFDHIVTDSGMGSLVMEVDIPQEERIHKKQHRFEVRVSGGKLDSELIEYSDDADADRAREKAVSRMLRNPKFQVASRREQLFDIIFAARPYDYLEYFVAERNNHEPYPYWKITKNVKQIGAKPTQGFRARVNIRMPSGNAVYDGEGLSKNSALTEACKKVIDNFGLSKELEQLNASSWTHRTQSGDEVRAGLGA